ncbi:hypothetical protein CTEN210_08944 [Chaetoceros tenuissimus]|uniref:CCDC43 PWI-like domain-containing protein n=1 Tax=Chaetoceros tenuissimus TaxID=426638 RepID=A0AAD3CV03_9STRA|nr:hypothetical protein CTEN210_08944 [Chaetoceros tenuissimus]
MSDENTKLVEFLNEKLPSLDLDSDTYLSYITGSLSTDEEELDEIIQLLQASSESYSEDDDTFQQLKKDILQLHTAFQQEMELKKEQDLQEKLEQMQLKQKQEFEASLLEKEQKQKELQKKREAEMDPAKKALIEQYAYDSSVKYDNDGNIIEEDTGAGEQVIGNKALAEKMNKERSQQLKGAAKASKKDEQAKSKQAKMDKMKQKEERRKRAQKGERKR